MALEIDGKAVETTAGGFLVDAGDWNDAVAECIADQEGLALTDRHWDVINFLREEFFDNGGNQPNTRTMVKSMQERWSDSKVNSKTLYDLFPGDPSKQAGRIGGLPESRRKGGY